jgi:hypothetical protein
MHTEGTLQQLELLVLSNASTNDMQNMNITF